MAATSEKRKRLGVAILKLVVLLLFTLNLYLFTSSTFVNNYYSSADTSVASSAARSSSSSLELKKQSDKFIIGLLSNGVVVKRPSNKETLNNTTTTTKTKSSVNFDECNFMRFANLESDQCDLVITVKTTASNYGVKLEAILQTWYKQAPSKVTKTFWFTK